MVRSRLIAVSASLLAAACTTEPPTVAVRSDQAPRSGIVLRVSVPDQGFTLPGRVPRWPIGLPDTIRITATNTGDQPVTLHFPSGCQILGYVRNAAGQLAWPPGGGWVCAQVLTTLEFQAHEVKTGAVVWATDSLPPGSYEVYAAFAAQEDSEQSNHVIQQLYSVSNVVALDSLRVADGAALPCCGVDSAGAHVTIVAGTLAFQRDTQYTDSVATPAGWRSGACVTEVPNGATIYPNGLVTVGDSVAYLIIPCHVGTYTLALTQRLDFASASSRTANVTLSSGTYAWKRDTLSLVAGAGEALAATMSRDTIIVAAGGHTYKLQAVAPPGY